MLSHGVAGFFNSYSKDFSAIYGKQENSWNHLVNAWFRKSMWLRFYKSIEGCEPIERKAVIDVGCGPGYYCIALAKRGARDVLGIDFAEKMTDLATENAKRAGVLGRCRFVTADFLACAFQDGFDHSIVMGFMDYARDPRQVIQKVVSLTRRRAFFSFPAAGGVLAWQRKLRYRTRCELFLYTAEQIRELFRGMDVRKCEIEKISRDFFVTVDIE